jgi:MFS transporter, PPP family, 3-phenylpropionic acid transporter
MPFLPLLLDARGLTPTQIAQVMFILPVFSLFVPSLWGMLADALRARVLLLRIASLGGALSMLLLLFDWKLAGSFLAVSCMCFFRSSVTPLADAAAHSMLEGSRARFSRIRLWGSLGFALFAGLGGYLDVSHHPERLVMISSTLYLIAFCFALRMEAPPLQHQPRVLGRTLQFIFASSLPLLLFGTVLHYVGHSMFDVYFGLHMRALHYDDSFVGLAWLIGVLCEVGVMFFGPRILAFSDPRRLMAFSTAAAIVRWFIVASTGDRALILASQTLHAFTFGLWYISMVKFVQDEAPEELRTSMQSVVLSSIGLGMMFGYLLGGVLFEEGGGRTVFLAAAVASTCATACYVRLASQRLVRAVS